MKPHADDINHTPDEAPWYLGHLPGPCPYLKGRESSLMFVDGAMLGQSYRALLDEGYRRHGKLLYRPTCRGCNECQVHRVRVDTFEPTKSQRRVWRKGSSIFEVAVERPQYTPERARLYRRYLSYQHGQTEAPLSASRYREFFVETCLGAATIEIQLRANGRIAALGLADVAGDALSSVYCYFDPGYADYSPGTYSALAEIDLAHRWGLSWYYLGYYIADCPAMNYKVRFGPGELRRLGSAWRPANEPG